MTNIESTIKELEAQADLIRVAIMSLRAIQTGKMAEMVTPGATIIGVTIAHLKAVGKSQTSAQIRAAIAAAGLKVTPGSIRTVLDKNGRTKKDIVRVGWGLWKLREWGKK